MRTIIILHQVDDIGHWSQSTQRKAEFERIGARIREFTGPEGSNQIGLIVDLPEDESAFQAFLQSDEAAAAMKADGVHPDTLLVLDEINA